MRIGIIGAGTVGTTLGNAFVRAGHEVVYGSRDEGRTPPHAGAKLGSIPGAVIDASVVVLSTPYGAAESALRAAGDFGGKVLIDATNAVGPGITLGTAPDTSGAERIAGLATNARVVKCFNTTGAEVMANPKLGAHRAVMLACGDDGEATNVATKLATDIGFQSIALPGLSRARDIEALAVLWIQLAMLRGLGREVAFGLAQRDRAGASADATVNLAAIGAPALGATTRRITILGSGNIGGGLARAWLRAGHDVRLAVRDPLAPDVVDLAEQGAKTIAIDGSARDTDVLVLAIPAAAVADALKRAGDLSGMIIVDATNGPWTPQQTAERAPNARVVRAFNQQGAETLRDARFGDLRAVSFVATDDDAARSTVLALSKDIGLDSIDAGPLANAHVVDHVTRVWLALSKALGSREFALTLLRRARMSDSALDG